MAFVKVAHLSPTPEGAIIPVEVSGQALVLVNIAGELHALSRKCTHMGADLCGGKIMDGAIVCPKHGAAFELTSGKAINPAKILFLKLQPKPLKTYKVKRDGEDILIDIS